MWSLTWHEIPLDVMAGVYVGLPPADRERLAREVAGLNAALRSDPLRVGESREGGHRITFVYRLAVEFRVDKASRTVRVTDVRPYGR